MYLASKGLTFKVLPVLDNVSGHPEAHEFNTEGAEVVYLPADTLSLNSASRLEGQKDLKDSLHTVLYGKDCQQYGPKTQ